MVRGNEGRTSLSLGSHLRSAGEGAVLAVIYAIPFIVLSLVACACCLVVPKLRRYALRALVVPIAFGFSSVVSAVMIVVGAAGLHRPIPEIMGFGGALIVIVIYIIPGILGTLLVLALFERILKRLGWTGGLPSDK